LLHVTYIQGMASEKYLKKHAEIKDENAANGAFSEVAEESKKRDNDSGGNQH
jgi:hypothetical protein